MYINQVAPTTGEAFIAVKKNRVKIYPTNLAGVKNSVYLSDKQEFEIELFNPSTTTKLAKISINGKPISSSGIVLKPGQRHFIDRYIDSPRKYKFETYVVENSSEALGAIQKNGLIEISFYDEYIPFTPIPTITYDLNWNNMNINCMDSSNLLRRRGTSADKLAYQSNADLQSFCSTTGGQTSSMNMDFMQAPKEKSRSLNSLKETGTVEQGSRSDQKFSNYSGSFGSFPINTVTIKILPYSEKPLEMSEIAAYCTECGAKNKGNKYKFCPSCGTKF